VSSDVARLFDDLADGYDDLEPWSEHLYRALHATLLTELAPPADGRARRALDAGCGTGLQTVLLERLGYTAHGIDLSAGLLAVARRRLAGAPLARGDLTALPYRAASFDAVTCCGSTLSLVDDAERALGEIGRVLRPGGLLLLEVEHRWSLDLLWALASSVAFDALGYGLRPAEAWRQLVAPGGRLMYPSGLPGGPAVAYRLRLFTGAELEARLGATGLRPVRRWGVHALTNVIPSTVLHRPRLARPLAALYRILCALDRAGSRSRLGQRLANSLVVLARKSEPDDC
jgi:MPBQ/MSBQ methyltransferase